MPFAEGAIFELIAYAAARTAVFSIVVLRCSLVIGLSPWPGRSVPGAVRLILSGVNDPPVGLAQTVDAFTSTCTPGSSRASISWGAVC